MISLIYDLTYTLPLSLILIILLRPYPETLPFFPAICLSGIIAETLIALVCHMKLKRALITFGAFITVLTGTLLSLKADGRKEFFGDYGYLFVTALLCLAVFLCQKLISVHLFPKILLSLSGILYLLAGLFFNFSNSRTLTALILFYAVMTLIESTEYFWKKEGMTGIREYTVYILPFPLIILIFLLLFTPPEKPYDWGFVKSGITFVRTKLELLLQSLDSSTGWDDSTAEMGFSENSSFLGGLNTTPTDSIKVITDKTSNGRLYLYGKTFDSFNGREWKKTDESDEFYQIYDLLETTGALLKYDPERSRDHIRSAVMSVRYTGIRTSRLFLPAKALPDKNALQLSSTGGDVRFSKNRLSSYRTLFYMINRRYEGFNSFLDSDVRCEAGDLKAAGEYLLSDSFTLPSADEFASYHEHIDAYYNTPVILSEKCRVFLDELLEGAVTDNEKLMRIEKLLSSLRYNAKTEPLPSSVQTPADFIDHILFEKKEGYCTHFATAFVLLARYENIPARYLQGYSTIASPVETDVKSNASHAWPEAYLSGKGWISYEPTPGYKNNGGWKIIDADGKESSASASLPQAVTDYDNETEETPLTKETAGDKRIDFNKFRLPIVLTIVFLLLALFADRLINNFRFKKMTDRNKTLILGKAALTILKRNSYDLKEGETLNELYIRCRQTIPEEMLVSLCVYEKTLYSTVCPSTEDVSLMSEKNKALKSYLFRKRFKRHILK